MTAQARLAGAAAGLALDGLVGEPPPSVPHPIAVLGRVLGGLEDRTYADSRVAGVGHATAGVGFAVAVAAMARALAGEAASTALVTATCAAGRMLGDVALGIGAHLEAGDLDAARAALPALVGRDPSDLDDAGIARAVVESVAENTVDAIVAPALWAAVLGAPGAAAHKAASTLDSMVGHRSARYERFGWASARLDDALAWAPARVTAALVMVVRPGQAGAVLRAVQQDAPAHPSPNAGVAEAAFAAALGLRLGGEVRYGERVEQRPPLGDGRPPGAADVRAAVELSRQCTAVLAGALAAGAVAVGHAGGDARLRRRRGRRPAGRSAGRR